MATEIDLPILARLIAEELRDRGFVQPQYLTTQGAAAYLSLSASTLERLRSEGCGPAYTKLAKAVRYSVADLDEWAESKRRRWTVEGGAA